MVGSGPNQAESMGSQCEDHFVNLEQRRDREVSVHTTHTSRSQSRNGSHLSHEEDTRALQLEIDHLKRKLHHERRKQTPSNFNFSSDNEEDGSYRHRSRTPPSESFSYEEDYHHQRRNRNSSSKGLGNDAMSKSLNQISRSPFMCKIEEGRLLQWFTQPTFTMYNSRTNLVEHISFNQRMAVHSKNEALMCKVFSSSLGLVTMRWFDSLGASSIDPLRNSLRLLGPASLHAARFLNP